MLASPDRGPGVRLIRTAFLISAIGMLALLHPPHAPAQETDYEEWLQKQQQEYKQFLTEQDTAFLAFLKQDWTNVRVDTTATTPIDDKPEQTPRIEPFSSNRRSSPTADSAPSAPSPHSRQPSSKPDAPSQNGEEQTPGSRKEAMGQMDVATDEQLPTETSPSPEPEQAPSYEQLPGESPPSPPAPGEKARTATPTRDVPLSFFGISTTVPYGAALVPSLEGAPSKSSIRNFWKTMARSRYRPTLDVLQRQREDIGLSDWGYYLYLKELGAKLYDDNSPNAQVLWTWFMMMKSGYAARVGYRQSKVFLMLPIAQKIYGRPQMYYSGHRYYLMVEEMSGSLRTYEGQHGKANQVLQLDEGSPPNVTERRMTRTVEFSFGDQRYALDLAYSPSTVEYLHAYPNVDLNVLMSTGVSSTAQSAFEETLHPLVADRGPRASVNLLLTFTQFATNYKRDQDHFGEERYLFPEESLASDYSDCEDRAILLSYLVRTLLNREVVGLQWPRHVALAVRTGDGLTVADDDHTVTVNGDTYIFADPTYIGSHLGMEMPLVEGQSPEIIMLDE